MKHKSVQNNQIENSPLLEKLKRILDGNDPKSLESFVKDELRTIMPNPTYRKKIRPCWEFRGLEIAQPTKLDWLAGQVFAPYIVKFHRCASTDGLSLFPQLRSLDLSY